MAATVTDVLPRGARALVLAATDGPEIRFEIDATGAEPLARGSGSRSRGDPDDALVFPERAHASPPAPVSLPVDDTGGATDSRCTASPGSGRS